MCISMLSFSTGEKFNIRGIMSINIRTNNGTTMRSLSEQGTFRNSMYQQGDGKKQKKPDLTRLKFSKDDISDQVVSNEKKQAGVSWFTK